MNLYGASVAIPKTTPEQELAAWLFTKWMTEPEQPGPLGQDQQLLPRPRLAAEPLDRLL
jgi:multiple sugar transport system substrate-binding protein